MFTEKAYRDEKKAFDTIRARIGKSGRTFHKPSGSGDEFPDFGITVTLENKKVDLFFEYKNIYTAQMGSMRDWFFDGTKFYTKDTSDESKQALIHLMNSTPEAIRNAKRLLKELQTHFHGGIKEIYSGVLTIIKDTAARNAAMNNFKDKVDNYTIAYISNTTVGKKITDHYQSKFSKELKPGRAQAQLLLMLIKDEVWIVDQSGQISAEEMKQIEKMLAVKPIPKMQGLAAQLEVRIQPRTPGKTNAARMDVMASYRLKGKPARGAKIL